MKRIKIIMVRSVQCFLLLFIYYVTVNCGFQPAVVKTCNTFSDYVGGQIKDLTDSDHGGNPPLFDDGTIFVYHGFGCAESNKSGTQDIIKVQQSLPIPAYATEATVFLNGWHLKYLYGPQNVAALGTWIYNICLNRGIKDKTSTLSWEAGGVLSDENFDNPYNWCYDYTVVAWNPSNINLAIDQNDGACSANIDDTRDANYFFANNKGTTTALSSFPTFINNSDFTSSRTVAILPRGFGFGWGYVHDTEFAIGEDHHLLQIAYNLDHSETFIESGMKYQKGLGDTTRSSVLPSLMPSPLQSDSGFVSWETYAIFKDNDTRRDYSFGEIVSGLGGNDVGMVQPPFSILPKKDESSFWTGCIGPNPLVDDREFVIENIPYTYAIPMLTGWELYTDPCVGDQKVKEIGIWIGEMHYEKNPGTPGILRYTLSSRLSEWAGGFRHKVTVLGLKAVPPPSRPRNPDLVPFSPLGTCSTAYCRIEQGQLRVTVKNQGNVAAGASKTTVTFGTIPVILDTPPIPAGGSVDLLFDVPADCFSPDCSFKITVDSDNQIDEFDEGNNTGYGVCKD